MDIDPSPAVLEMVRECYGNVVYLREMVQEIERSQIVGPTGSTSKVNEAAPHAAIVLYRQMQDDLVRWSKTAHDMGIDERRIELEQGQAQLLAGALRAVTDGLRAALANAGVEGAVLDVVFREELPGLGGQALRAISREVGGGGQ